MVLKIKKNVPSSKRGEHVEYTFIIKNDFFVFQNTEKGVKPKI